MSLNPKLSLASRVLALDAALDVLNGGFIDIFDGIQPTDADTAIGAQVKLARLALNATAFAAASAGSKTANAITSAAALASGTATWYRLVKSDGTTAVADGSVGTATSNLVINSATISAGATVSVTSLVYTMAA
jgi:hypothetical protein